VEELANKHGVSMAQIAFAWVAGKDGVSAPIIGSTSVENLKDLIGKYTSSVNYSKLTTIQLFSCCGSDLGGGRVQIFRGAIQGTEY
jgi:aryl-alcohol dehydrogenase-like predicted oxidoreductase